MWRLSSLRQIVPIMTILLIFPFSIPAAEKLTPNQNIEDCQHMLISHIRSFRGGWNGFKAATFLRPHLARRLRATMLFRFPLENYAGSAESLMNLDMGADALQLIRPLHVIIGSNLYAVGEGSSNQIIEFSERLVERIPSLQPEFQILDSEPLVFGDMGIHTKILRLDLNRRDSEQMIAGPIAELEVTPRRGFIVYEAQMNETVYFFARVALGPILEIDGFLRDNYLHMVDANDSLTLAGAMTQYQTQLSSNNGIFVRWRNLIFMNGIAAQAVLDFRGQPKTDTSRSTVQVHTRLLELIRTCREELNCAAKSGLVKETMGLIANLADERTESEVEPPVIPSKPPRNVTRAIVHQPKWVRDRELEASQTAPKPAPLPAKPTTTASVHKPALADTNPVSKPLQAALHANWKFVTDIQEDSTALAEWVRNSDNQLRLKVADFYLETLKPLLDQYEQQMNDQNEVTNDPELLAVLKAEHEETTRKLNQARTQLTDELLATGKGLQTAQIEISADSGPLANDIEELRDMYSSLAKLKQWKFTVTGENSGIHGLRSASLRIEGRGSGALEHEAGLHRFMDTAPGLKTRTSYVKVVVNNTASAPTQRNSPYVRTYDLRKAGLELERLLNGETLAGEIDSRLREQAIERFLRIIE